MCSSLIAVPLGLEPYHNSIDRRQSCDSLVCCCGSKYHPICYIAVELLIAYLLTGSGSTGVASLSNAIDLLTVSIRKDECGITFKSPQTVIAIMIIIIELQAISFVSF